MTKHLFASEDVMEEYLTALLTEPTPPENNSPTVLVKDVEVADKPHQVDEPSLKPVAELLAEVTQSQHGYTQQNIDSNIFTPASKVETLKTDNKPVLESVKEPAKIPTELTSTTPKKNTVSELEPVTKINTRSTVADKVNVADDSQVNIDSPPPTIEVPEAYREGDFQALYFCVSGLTVAVPLTELGGIHNMEKLNPLFGKPDWFMGVMLHREEKLNIVDTARWVMPEKYDDTLAESLNYQYVVMLGDSHWGLACESLVNTLVLKQSDVKWRESFGKRPWLAGLVKEKMCALLNVKQLIKLLDQGLGS